MDIVWLQALYDFGADCEYVAVPDAGLSKLTEMADDLVGSNGLVAIYIPEGTEEAYNPDVSKYGRVMGTVRLVPMPPGRRPEDYTYEDPVSSEVRWPYGWPCEVVHCLPVDQAPRLRSMLLTAHGDDQFGPYVKRLQIGPFRLDRRMAEALTRYFAAQPRISATS